MMRTQARLPLYLRISIFALAGAALACNLPSSRLDPLAAPAAAATPLSATPATIDSSDGAMPAPPDNRILPPPAGFLYHGVYPGGQTGDEDDITLADLRSYEAQAGKTAVWVYFSHNWFRGRAFPAATAGWIREAGSIPYIRLMLRSDSEQNHPEGQYTLDRLIQGGFDPDLRAWFQAARDFDSPLIVEYGTEVNGEWFPWNGVWNGAGQTEDYGDPDKPDGPERFQDAYRRIIQISREENATNITWVFHANHRDIPDEDWNRLENYYPGDDWIDWLGVSVYGALSPLEDEWPNFRQQMDEVYPRLAALSPSKPVVVLEFAAAGDHPRGDQADWARLALADMTSMRWPRLSGFAWWNEAWQNDDNPAHDTNLRLQDNPALAQAFQELVGQGETVLGEANLPIPSDAGSEVHSPAGANAVWTPSIGMTWQWQLTGEPVDTSFAVDVYDIDLFDSTADLVADLHAQGRGVICYISVGSWEEWRPDQDQFPESVLGAEYEGWPGERWLDIRQLDLLAPVMRARLDLCQAKGFDAVEPDNIDGYMNDTGFPLTYADQLRYNRWLASEARARGLSIGLKNDPEQAADLAPYFDWAMTEDCFAEGWCEDLLPFIEAGKPVFAAEYTDTGASLDQFCPQAERLGFSVILKHRDLDAWQAACP